MNQCWQSYWRTYASLGLNELFKYWHIPEDIYFIVHSSVYCCGYFVMSTQWSTNYSNSDHNGSFVKLVCCYIILSKPGGRFKNAYELLNLRALKISMLYKIHIFQCMGKIFCVEFERVPLKFHTKYHTHTLKDVDFIHGWNFKSS